MMNEVKYQKNKNQDNSKSKNDFNKNEESETISLKNSDEIREKR